MLDGGKRIDFSFFFLVELQWMRGRFSRFSEKILI